MKKNTSMKMIMMLALTMLAVATAPLFAQADKEGKSADSQGSGPAGFGSLQWGSALSASKESVNGKITFIDEKRVIITREGDIEYRYGFFFRDPSIDGAKAPEKNGKKTADKAEVKDDKAAQQEEPEAKLYYVLMRFPYLHMEEVKKKISEKYNRQPTGETLKDHQGALIWDFEKTSIIMWVDNYEKNPFCRKITYIGKDIAKDVNEYQKKVFTVREMEILRTLNP